MYLLLSTFFALIATLSFQPSAGTTATEPISKTYCMQSTGFQSVDDLKAALLVNAKRLAVDELFGERISASTAVENFVVTSDQIRATSLGLLRIDGNVTYFNGDNFAEACVTIEAYVTNQDLAKFEPVELSKKACITDPNLTTKQIAEAAKIQAIIEAITDYDPKLASLSKEALTRLMLRVEYPESGFVPDTETYCARVVGQIVPIEAMAALDTDGETSVGELHSIGSTNSIDDFNGNGLGDRWTILNEDEGKWSLGKRPGSLRIYTSGGDFDNECATHRNLFVQDTPNGDYTMMTKVSMFPTERYQQGGLIAFVDADNYIKLDHLAYSERGKPVIQNVEFVLEENRQRSKDNSLKPITPGTKELFLKLVHTNDLYTGYYSYDGTSWNLMSTVRFAGTTPPRIGLFALKGRDFTNNWSCDNPTTSEIPVDFDYFKVLPNN